MPSDSHRTRLKPTGAQIKCKQCGAEKADAARQDGLGKNCGIWADKGKKFAAEKRAATKR